MKKNKIIEIIKWLWLVLVLAGASYYFYKNWNSVSLLVSQIKLWRILLSLLLIIIGKAFIVLFMKFSVNAEGWHPEYIKLMGLYGLSGLGKYIPGGVWHFVGRFGAYKMSGMTVKSATRSLILENLWLISSAAYVGLTGLTLSRFDLVSQFLKIKNQTWISILFVIGYTLLWYLGLLLAHHILNKYTKERIQNPWTMMIIGILVWVFIGGGFFVMFSDFGIQLLPVFIGGYALSWTAGYLFVIAPGGIGIREVSLSFVFSTIASLELITVYGTMNRILFTVAELLYGLLGVLQKRTLQLSVHSKHDTDDLKGAKVSDVPSHEDTSTLQNKQTENLEADVPSVEEKL